MDISQAGLDLIKEFEGLRLQAYLDPVGIPTIGYGSIRYPSGQKVRMGDIVSSAEAEGFLRFECDAVGAQLGTLVAGRPLNQNQSDALISFCFNVGLGAFQQSTLLQKLKTGDVAGAAAEFPKWNKATENGIKRELPGLTARRAKERALFETGGAVTPPPDDKPSPQERVVLAKGYREGSANVIAGFDKDGAAVDIVELDDSAPTTFTTVLINYPNLKQFDFARAGETVPQGSRVHISGLARATPHVRGAPRMTRDLLMLGGEDMEDPPGDDIRNMQTRLAELGYYFGPINGIFDRVTDLAVRDFQEDFFGPAEADGLVGPITWKKLWGEGAEKPVDRGTASTKNFLKLTKTDQRDKFGCYVLLLSYYKQGLLVGSLEVCSGQARKQTFRIGRDSPSGSMEPLPEGKWSVGDIKWAAGKDIYTGAIWSDGLGPAKIPMDYAGPGSTPRAAIEIHMDWNRPTAPGTAGCIGLQNVADFKTLVSWLRDTDPRDLFVDWNLGTCPSP